MAEAAQDLYGKLLGILRRNLAFIDAYLARGGTLDEGTMTRLDTCRLVYAQQPEMLRIGRRSVPCRPIRLIPGPFLRA
ncbi:MAG: hypothetical protein ILO10_02940 [Kiritimatiellae bacterium]|nr:hypothetical protein [Kiritimatiellia bacterium]